MTPYQQLEKALIAYGWTRTQGKGDHLKFTKAGVPTIITLSRALSDNGRSYNNVLSMIRQWIPDFEIGRPVKSKDRKSEDAYLRMLQQLTPEQQVFRQDHWFIRVGEKVRYLTPEQGDFEALRKPSSVMNIPYAVKAIRNTISVQSAGEQSDKLFVVGPDDIVVIGHPDWDTIEVHPDELASWDLQECPCCRQSRPLSAMVQDPGAGADGDTDNEMVCGECMDYYQTEMRFQLEKLKGSVLKMMEKQPALLEDDALSCRELFANLVEGIDKKSIAYWMNEVFNAENGLSTIIDNIEKKYMEFQKSVQPKRKPGRPAQARKMTMYQLWADYRETFLEMLRDERISGKGDFKDLPEKEAKRLMSSWTYTVEREGELVYVKVHVSLSAAVNLFSRSLWVLEKKLDEHAAELFDGKPHAVCLSCPPDPDELSISGFVTFKKGEELDRLVETLRENLSPSRYRNTMTLLLFCQAFGSMAPVTVTEILKKTLREHGAGRTADNVVKAYMRPYIEKDSMDLEMAVTGILESETDVLDARSLSDEILSDMSNAFRGKPVTVCLCSKSDDKGFYAGYERFSIGRATACASSMSGGADKTCTEAKDTATTMEEPEEVPVEAAPETVPLCDVQLCGLVDELERRGFFIRGLRTVRKVSMVIDIDNLL